MFNKIVKGIKGVYIYVLANIIICLHYDRKYTKSSWFGYGKKGYRKWLSIGWKWVVDDYRGCKKLNVNRKVPWPVSPRCSVVPCPPIPDHIVFDPECINIFQSYGIYFQAFGRIVIGKGSTIGPNVGLITSNHDPANPDTHLEPKDIIIGENCWIGMNSMILPGVTLGGAVTVGAGSVVTKSFPEGHCVIAGNPAVIIRKL
ncbi:MAG: acyltransferase [Candidatus Gastranaerophilales bacterium]|nr:acyltransferase [Candidatus Gastranaerophilales bacterium]